LPAVLFLLRDLLRLAYSGPRFGGVLEERGAVKSGCFFALGRFAMMKVRAQVSRRGERKEKREKMIEFEIIDLRRAETGRITTPSLF